MCIPITPHTHHNTVPMKIDTKDTVTSKPKKRQKKTHLLSQLATSILYHAASRQWAATGRIRRDDRKSQLACHPCQTCTPRTHHSFLRVVLLRSRFTTRLKRLIISLIMNGEWTVTSYEPIKSKRFPESKHRIKIYFLWQQVLLSKQTNQDDEKWFCSLFDSL